MPGKKKLLCTVLALLLCLTALSGCAEEYIGENAHGAGGVIRVKVTMEGDKIVKIKTVEQHETEGLGTDAIKKLTKAIVAANSTEVDGIAGATLTSVTFKAAVRQAVETALGTGDALDFEVGENEYLGLSKNALGGRLVVKLTVVDGTITAVEVLESHESADIGDPAIEIMKQRILNANAAEVEIIAGATYTCIGMKEAAQMALEAANK